ncbi:Methionyl-tRNA formyltransferase [Candidatus Providencia siddallii]|uniref:Methionyl-tRNA formyltransferase n=1 Tax=Candidatus Providencia siddallii TaxID=1715285 RepID=A0A0M6W7K0_9GAMM|nr:Methionyl-tRNA formyltransferase [Candidatus Providencia siddallii]
MEINKQTLLKIIFAGTPNFAAICLKALLKTKHQIVGVLTCSDKPKGRGNKITYSPVKILAENHKIPIFQPISLKDIESQKWIKEKSADLIIVVAYRLILPKSILNIPRLGCINLHCSLLPRWRGAAPIQRSICAGDNKGGISIIQMDDGVDTGDIIYKSIININTNDTTETLNNKLSIIGSEGLINTINLLLIGKYTLEKQDDAFACYAKKLSKKEAYINWKQSAIQIERQIRAFNPWPLSHFLIQKKIIKVWKAEVIIKIHNKLPGTIISVNKNGINIATGDGVLNIIQLQPSGKKIMTVRDILNYRYQWFIPENILE